MKNNQKRCDSRKQTKNKNPTIQSLPLPKTHRCYGCVWYPRDTEILYCPFQSCIYLYSTTSSKHFLGLAAGNSFAYPREIAPTS